MSSLDNYFQEEDIEKNICRWNLNVYNCQDDAYYRSVYYIKSVIAIGVSLLDSVLIIYRMGIKRRNLITPYGIASIDGLLIFLLLYSYSKFYFYLFLFISIYIYIYFVIKISIYIYTYIYINF